MMGAAGEVVLPCRAHKQPSPYICIGGDCGACSLGGVLGLAVPDLYSRWGSKGITNRTEMGRCLRCASSDGLASRMIDTPAQWPDARYLDSFGSPAVHEALPWFQYVRMAVDAGYYGVTEVDYDAHGGPETNHWVLICGARTNGAENGKALTGEVLISCSVKGERWIEAREFLRTMGGYAALFVRPLVSNDIVGGSR